MIVWFVIVACLWVQMGWVLVPTWTDGTYYDYGWLVLPFAALFWFQRFRDVEDRSVFVRPSWVGWKKWLLIGGFLMLLPLRIVEDIDVYWRLSLWLHVSLVFVISVILTQGVLGWRRTFHLLPAYLFALVAVPLPSFIEYDLVRGLTKQVVDLSSGFLPMIGYPVEVRGNAFIVNGSLLDVAEGCSGIRSFQSSAMAAICFGELFRMNFWKRVGLVLGGIGMAVVCNSLRVVTLVSIAFKEGSEVMEHMHDRVGLWALVMTYVCIGLSAWILAQRFWGKFFSNEEGRS